MSTNLQTLFPKRIGRRDYFVRLLVLFALIGCLVFIGFFSWGALNSVPAPLVIVPLFAFYFMSVLLPRVRDVGLHGGFVLIALVPPINVLFLIGLLFIPSNAFRNPSQFG